MNYTHLELQDFRPATARNYYRVMRKLSDHFGQDPAKLREKHLREFFVLNRDTGQRETRTMEGVEFIRRFLLHALPSGFHRIGYRGFLHARGKARLLWLQLQLNARLQARAERTEGSEEAPPQPRGPHCGGLLRKTNRIARAPPSQRNKHFFHLLAA